MGTKRARTHVHPERNEVDDFKDMVELYLVQDRVLALHELKRFAYDIQHELGVLTADFFFGAAVQRHLRKSVQWHVAQDDALNYRVAANLFWLERLVAKLLVKKHGEEVYPDTKAVGGVDAAD